MVNTSNSDRDRWTYEPVLGFPDSGKMAPAELAHDLVSVIVYVANINGMVSSYNKLELAS